MNTTYIPDLILFGRQLKKCRQMAKVTQEQLAEQIENDPSLISHYERGKGLPDTKKLDIICNYLLAQGASKECLEKLREYSGYRLDGIVNHQNLSRLVLLLDELEDEPLAKSLLEEILEIIIGDWNKFLNAQRELKRSYWEDARDTFAEMLSELQNELPIRRRLSVRILQGLANACRFLGDPIKGLEFLDQAIETAKSIGDPEYGSLAEIYLDRGKFYRRLNEWDKAKNDFFESRRIIKKLGRTTNENYDRFIAITERKLAGTFLFQGKAREALEYCDRSIKICRDIKDIEEECKGLQHRAWSQALIGHWDEALKIHKGVVDILRNRNTSNVLMAKSFRYLADTYRMCGILEKAETIYDEALNSLQNHLKGKGEVERDYLVYGTILLGKGATYRANPLKRNGAEVLLSKSLSSHIQLRARLHEGLTRSELGRLANSFDDFRTAERELQKAKTIFEELNNLYYYVAQLINLSSLEIDQSNYPKASAYLNTATTLSEKNGFDVHWVRAQIGLAKINKIEQGNESPLSLCISALVKARTLNYFLVNEILAKIINKQYFLTDENALNESIYKLCKSIRNEGQEILKNSIYKEFEKENWEEEIAKLQNYISHDVFSPVINGYALIIGIAEYQNLMPLSKSSTDAHDLYDLLLEKNYYPNNLFLLLDGQASKHRINEEFDKLAKLTSPDDTIVIFFSGHGAQRIGGFEIGEYICPVDANKDSLKLTAISNQEFTDAIRALSARQVVVFLDACHSGGVGEPKDVGAIIKSGLSEATFEQLASGEGRVVIASCKPNEVSWELHSMRNGVFSHCLLDGLRGAATGRNGIVGVLNLFEYLSLNVPNLAPQHPIFKGEIEKNFPLIVSM